IPLRDDLDVTNADQSIYAYLRQKGAPGVTGLVTTYCTEPAAKLTDPYRFENNEAHGPAEEAATVRAVQGDGNAILFSFRLPTRNRIPGLSALFASIEAMTARPDELEIILAIDEDDEASRGF